MSIESLRGGNNFEPNQNTKPTGIKEQGSDGAHSITKTNKTNFLSKNHSPGLHQSGDSSLAKWTIATMFCTLIRMTDTANVTENATMSSMSTLKNNASDVLTNTTESTLTDAQEVNPVCILIAAGLVIFGVFLLLGGISIYAKKHPILTSPAVGPTVDGKKYIGVSETTDKPSEHHENQQQEPVDPLDIDSQPGTSGSVTTTV
ncbi:hypothetical protein [Endozoicomonas sp.]|uniref:hypothetical protein n=1 Tax=Endozoicomonas sp. TaxID=1892382 RepID=UPI0028859A87|nr:hypothetical protein [Endozoicomonas sp.]